MNRVIALRHSCLFEICARLSPVRPNSSLFDNNIRVHRFDIAHRETKTDIDTNQESKENSKESEP